MHIYILFEYLTLKNLCKWYLYKYINVHIYLWISQTLPFFVVLLELFFWALTEYWMCLSQTETIATGSFHHIFLVPLGENNSDHVITWKQMMMLLTLGLESTHENGAKTMSYLCKSTSSSYLSRTELCSIDSRMSQHAYTVRLQTLVCSFLPSILNPFVHSSFYFMVHLFIERTFGEGLLCIKCLTYKVTKQNVISAFRNWFSDGSYHKQESP